MLPLSSFTEILHQSPQTASYLSNNKNIAVCSLLPPAYLMGNRARSQGFWGNVFNCLKWKQLLCWYTSSRKDGQDCSSEKRDISVSLNPRKGLSSPASHSHSGQSHALGQPASQGPRLKPPSDVTSQQLVFRGLVPIIQRCDLVTKARKYDYWI